MRSDWWSLKTECDMSSVQRKRRRQPRATLGENVRSTRNRCAIGIVSRRMLRYFMPRSTAVSITLRSYFILPYLTLPSVPTFLLSLLPTYSTYLTYLPSLPS